MKIRAIIIPTFFVAILSLITACDKEYEIYSDDVFQQENNNPDDPVQDSTIDINDYFSNSVSLHDFAFDSQNRLWAATNRGLLLLDSVSSSIINTQSSPLTDNDINYISIDDENRAWICINEAIFMYDIENLLWQSYTSENTDAYINHSSKVYTDRPGHLYMFSFDDMYEFDGNSWQLKVKLNALFENFGYYIQTDAPCSWHDTTMWINSYDGLIALYNDSTAHLFNTANSGISDNSLVGVHTDDNGNVWMTNDSGIEMYDGENWHVFSDHYYLMVQGNTVLSYADNRTYKWENNNWNYCEVGNNQYHGHFNNGIADRNGNIWLSRGDIIYKTSLRAE